MALAALDTAHLCFGDLLAAFNAVVDADHFLIIAVILIIDTGALVALDTPFHSKWRVLIYFLHSLDRAMALLAF
jgi:hypothetical protein